MRKLSIFLFLLLLPALLYAAAPDNSRALSGLKSAGVIFDVNTGHPSRLLLRLNLVEETVVGLTNEGVVPDVVVAFRGGATFFMTRGNKYIPVDDQQIKQEIQTQVRRLKKLGYRVEQCAVAVRLLKVDPKDIIDDVPLVGNGYISMIGYQNRGYAFIPMD